MSILRRYIVAGIVTAAMPFLTIGAPMLVNAAHVGDGNTQTIHYSASR